MRTRSALSAPGSKLTESINAYTATGPLARAAPAQIAITTPTVKIRTADRIWFSLPHDQTENSRRVLTQDFFIRLTLPPPEALQQHYAQNRRVLRPRPNLRQDSPP